MMRKAILILYLLMGVIENNAQNLVINGDFEEYALNRQLNQYWGVCDNWEPAIRHCTPDHFYENNPFKFQNIPDNTFGSRIAYSGKAYVGIVPIDWYGGMESITGELKEPLRAGSKYKVSFYVSYAGSYCPFYVIRLGLRFTKPKERAYKKGDSFYWEAVDHAITYHIANEEPLKADTTWQQISGIYIAKGGETNITIGMFYEDSMNIADLKKASALMVAKVHYKATPKKIRKADLELNKIQEESQGYIKKNYGYDKEEAEKRHIWFPYYYIDKVEVKLIPE